MGSDLMEYPTVLQAYFINNRQLIPKQALVDAYQTSSPSYIKTPPMQFYVLHRGFIYCPFYWICSRFSYTGKSFRIGDGFHETISAMVTKERFVHPFSEKDSRQRSAYSVLPVQMRLFWAPPCGGFPAGSILFLPLPKFRNHSTPAKIRPTAQAFNLENCTYPNVFCNHRATPSAFLQPKEIRLLSYFHCT